VEPMSKVTKTVLTTWLKCAVWFGLLYHSQRSGKQGSLLCSLGSSPLPSPRPFADLWCPAAPLPPSLLQALRRRYSLPSSAIEMTLTHSL